MSSVASSKRPLTQLNHEIEAAEADLERLESERRTVASDAASARRRLAYYRLARRVRTPLGNLELWPLVVMLFGPLTIGFLTLAVVHFISGSFPAALFAFLVSIVAGVGLFGALMYHPADTQLPIAVSDAEAQIRLVNARLQEKTARIIEIKERLQALIDERRDQIASGRLQRAALLQRGWKSMAGAEWEDFIVEVLRTHGAKVDRTGRGDIEDDTLVADFSPRRVAIFTEGDGQNVASTTVQQAIAAKERLGCDSAAVIINRQFTGAAREYAQRSGCTAIGSAEFPDFVLGKISI